MIRHTKIYLKKIIFSALLSTQVFISCNANNATPIADNPAESSEIKLETTKAVSTEVNATQWIYIKSVPIVATGTKSNTACDDKKYGDLNIRIQNDSVFLFDTYTDKVSTGEVKSKDFFKEKYLYDFYKKMLADEVKIKLAETIKYARNTRAYSKDSKLDAYFRDAFFIDQFMFIESKGCVYIYKKNAAVKADAVTAVSKITDASQKPLELPFDFNDYYKSCVYPSDKSCNGKYPSAEFKNDSFLKMIESAVGITDPAIYFLIPNSNKEVTTYLIAYQGNDNDSYHLVSVKDNNAVSKLEVGSMDGTTLNDFVISKDGQINLYTRKNANDKRKAVASYKIATSGKFEKQK